MKPVKRTFLLFTLLVGSFAAAQEQTRDLASELRQTWDEIGVLAQEREQAPSGDERDVVNTRIGRLGRTFRADEPRETVPTSGVSADDD